MSEQGKPYPIAEMFAKLHADIAGARTAGLPQERPAPPRPPAPTAAEAAAELERREWKPGTGIVVSAPRVGKGPVLKDVASAGGAVLGDFSMMLSYPLDGQTAWTTCSRVTAAETVAPNRWRVVCEGQGRKGKSSAFAFTLELTLFPGAPCFLVDVVELRNTGTLPLEVRNVYFRPQVPYAAENVAAVPPNLWKRPSEARWQASDGRWFGARSTAATARRFSFVYNAERKSQHPDASFEPETPQVLAPGSSYHPAGTMWCIVEGGTARYLR